MRPFRRRTRASTGQTGCEPGPATAPDTASPVPHETTPDTPRRRLPSVGRRLLIALVVAAIAALPGAEAVGVSRVGERALPGSPAMVSSWPDDSRATDLDGEAARGTSPPSWSTTTRGGAGTTATARLVGDLGDNGIPTVALRAYTRAARTLALADPACGLRWSLLAAIGRVESNHGRFGGAGLQAAGTPTHPIRGVALDGRDDVARILDTDGGSLDGDGVYDRAVGPMQFIPSTWRRVASDGNDDGRSDPHNIYDAALAAAVYLCAGDLDLRDVDDRERAVLRYNHSRAYAATVLALASAYERGLRDPLPAVGPARTPPATVRWPTLPPANPGPTPSLERLGRTGRHPTSSSASTATTRPPSSSTRPPTSGPATTSTTRPPTSGPATTSTTRPPTSDPSSTSTTSTTSTSTTTTTTSTSTTSSSTTSTSTTTTSTTQPPGPALHQVTGDRLPSGAWSLWAGGDARRATLEMRLPGRAWRDADTPAVLSQRWAVASGDGRHVVWGLVPAEVTVVAVTLTDGRVVTIPTVDPALAGAGVRAFAAQLPEGVSISAAEGRRAGGGVAVAAQDVAASLAPVAGFDPAVRATVPVGPAG